MDEDDAAFLVDSAMKSTATLFVELAAAIRSKTSPSTEQLRKWKKLSATANKHVGKSTRLFWQAEDRVKIEASILKKTMQKERLDRDANLARVLEKLRSHSVLHSSGLDRACGAAIQVQVALSQLAPLPVTAYHGASYLSLTFGKDASGNV